MQNKADARHESLKRLLAASQLAGPAALAAALVESEQTVTNWAKRGVSKAGAMKAQAAFGCSANWVLQGTLPQFIQAEGEPSREDQPRQADIGYEPTTVPALLAFAKQVKKLPATQRKYLAMLLTDMINEPDKASDIAPEIARLLGPQSPGKSSQPSSTTLRRGTSG